MNKEKLEQAAKLLIEAIGDDPKREGLFETPKRFAEMIQEQFAYVGITNDEIAKKIRQNIRNDRKRHSNSKTNTDILAL